MRVSVVLLITLALSTLSGCISASDFGDEEETPRVTEAAPTVLIGREVQTATLPASVVVGRDGGVGPVLEVDAPKTVLDVKLDLTRDRAATDLRVHVDTPNGDQKMRDWTGENLSITLEAPGEGAIEVWFDSDVNAETVVTLESTVRWLASSDTVDRGVRVVKDGNGYRAEVVYFTNNTVDSVVTADVDLSNGKIDIAGTTDDGSQAATATLTTWARAASEAEARRLVLDLDVTFALSDKKLTAVVDNPNDGTSTGSSGSFVVPATLRGMFDTSNGAISLSDVDAADLTLDTSNGKVTGAIAARGSLDIDTSNGKIDLRLTPTGDLKFNLDTSNGAVDLSLANDAERSYDLDVDTSNGEITESMDGTTFHATDDDNDAGNLKTDGGARDHHTSGVVDTSNGDVHFADA